MTTIALALPDEISADEARLLLAVKLLELHKVSIGKAAEIAGYSKASFMEIAGKYGFAVYDYPPGDLAKELAL